MASHSGSGPFTLSIDIGGTGTKMLVLDGEGNPVTERTREPTPDPATPDAVLDVIRSQLGKHGGFDRVSVGFPGVVKRGVVFTAPNLDTDLWQGQEIEERLTELTGKPTRVINDADLQGYGVVTSEGVELVLTLGTGLGAALFVNGHLVPNLELAHHPFQKGKTYEQRVGEAELDRIGKRRWSERVIEMLEQLEPILNYDRVFIGGGNVKKLKLELPKNVSTFDNVQGMRGGIRLWQDDARPTGLLGMSRGAVGSA